MTFRELEKNEVVYDYGNEPKFFYMIVIHIMNIVIYVNLYYNYISNCHKIFFMVFKYEWLRYNVNLNDLFTNNNLK